MVGVSGKYKGCETCRRRRIKCSNERPFCQKCVSTGRHCEGYERERVFITGTPESRGRVASHPKKESTKGLNNQQDRPNVVPSPPFNSAWNDHITLSVDGIECFAWISVLHATLETTGEASPGSEHDAGYFKFEAFPNATTDLYSSEFAELDTSAQCLLSHAGPSSHDGQGVVSHCVFTYGHKHAAVAGGSTSAHAAPLGHVGLMRQLGPAHFVSFPHHFLFVRIFRPIAMNNALLNRQPTFLAEHEWATIPWGNHPKSSLDHLFDLMLTLPAIFASTDQLLSAQATLERRMGAQDLLQTCLTLERRFTAWFDGLNGGGGFQSHLYWTDDLVSAGGLLPFSCPYNFKDGQTGLMLLYYWMAQILFHRCIDNINRAIFEPVIDAFPIVWPILPPGLQIDPAQYQQGREIAANICCGLDYVLENTAQPNLVVAPMMVALNCYKEINSTSVDGVMEIMWLESFKDRLGAKCQQTAVTLQSQSWTELVRV
ncbi:hypothetical protein S7711_06008 [Stachybotrys chartarum IBT 7711]|uniref:Zn(2)-C6 fungal-type domain-containing protein n=1 Tax=Stachybotrys chartarum (strain CBS 109288 / IBT 7711) TaxID=1280523 RepID=A0A084B2T7_STACB|nr:hypothetical protein S7711_06008 [Stachybotrys chartarum IBT 7711]